jgi:hypothetical protein
MQNCKEQLLKLCTPAQIYCNVLVGSISRWNFIALQKSIHYSQTSSETLRTHVHVRPAWSRNTHSYRILPTGPLVAIFQHSLPFLRSESFQTHFGTIHRCAIGPLALHNGTSVYTSLTHHLPAPTIGCLHRPPYKLTCFRPTSTRSLTILSYLSRSSKTPNPVSMELSYSLFTLLHDN